MASLPFGGLKPFVCLTSFRVLGTIEQKQNPESPYCMGEAPPYAVGACQAGDDTPPNSKDSPKA